MKSIKFLTISSLLLSQTLPVVAVSNTSESDFRDEVSQVQGVKDLENVQDTDAVVDTQDTEGLEEVQGLENLKESESSSMDAQMNNEEESEDTQFSSDKIDEQVSPVKTSGQMSSKDDVQVMIEEVNSETSKTELNENEAESVYVGETPIITEDNQNVLGSTIKQARNVSSNYSYLSSTNASLPRKDFIDVASHQSSISIKDYQNMKSQGVTGVVVKLTEGTTYMNPYASSQIANAKSAGLKVSAYHFSHFNTAASAKAEANYFAAAAKKLGLATNTVLVNDAEHENMTKGNVTSNSVTFANQLKANGYGNVIHYASLFWFQSNSGPLLNMNSLGGAKKAWVAQYPYTPSKNNLLNTGNAAWQWGSTMKFVGDSNSSRLFDVNIDYTYTFSQAPQGKAINRKVFINKNNGAIYAQPYTLGTARLDTTSGMLNQVITLNREQSTYYGTWYCFTYKKNNITKTGWIKSTDVKNYNNEKAYNKTMYINKTNGIMYKDAYVPGVGQAGKLSDVDNKVVKLNKVKSSAYSTWYQGTYTQKGVSKTAWFNSNDLVSEIYIIKSINMPTFINNGYAAIYETPYISGTKRLDVTSGMLHNKIQLTGESKTSAGTWYRFNYKKSGVNKTGWIKSTDISQYINSQNINKTLKIGNERGAVYQSAYVAGTKKIGETNGFASKAFKVTKKMTTPYGIWFHGSYKQGGKSKTGWIKSCDLEETLSNKSFAVVANAGAVYKNAYKAGTARIDLTTGLTGSVVKPSKVTETEYGTWYYVSYTKNGAKKAGWIKSNDMVASSSYSKNMQVTTNKGAIYLSPYVKGTKRIDLTTDMSGKRYSVMNKSSISSGTWYQIKYTKSGKGKIGWVKSTDIH
ncbi:GH25 family lysozyme [Vagococcus xieshaowenii]|uniref:GW domain-containing protein n=1 Tax=Vagococcus xieshaowenii TaxID=2562451 RepID=A0AAJ5EEK5_9ENTE|nr:GH25 family lysozyme [Vagococcus xieshaowenii]QCA29269.1 hypothetical protein E4Z98_08035 [Vagococcus xieshaowenii]TFZ39849.1 hypothetical protein E4031_08440 [Vagococcus xieshaowenii]